MSPGAEAKAGSAPNGLFGALDYRSDLGTVRHCRERLEGRPYALKRIGNGLPDSPAHFCQSVGEIGVAAIAHSRIVSLAQT